MLKRIVNSASIDFEIHPIDPILIKSGQATVGGTDMSFVRTYRFGEEDEPYIPGSSLKGMMRAYGEKICRSLRNDPVPVCLPYVEPGRENYGEKRQASCGLSLDKYKKKRNRQTAPSSELYRNSCPACRLFGSLGFTGRFASSDAYLSDRFKETGKPLLEIRDGVAIDRITGGAAPRAKYDLEVLTRGDFSTTIELRNFERWQLGLTGLILGEMEEERVRLGFGKSRGLGKFKATVTDFKLTYYQKTDRLAGLASFCSDEESRAYGLFPETGDDGDSRPLPEMDTRSGVGLRREYTITDSWKELLAPAVDDLVVYVGKSDWPACLENLIK